MAALGARTGKSVARPAPRLLLTRPGSPPEPVVETTWRALVAAPGGDIAPEAVAAKVRVSPMASKAEKALMAAIAADDTEKLAACAEAEGEIQGPAHLLLGLRLATADPNGAVAALGAALDGAGEPWDHKAVRRYFPGLQVCTLLAPGVPVILAADREAVTLLQAEMLGTLGRQLDTVHLLTQAPLTPVVALALAALYLATGQNEAVVSLTEGLQNFDDLTALCLVARGVALRTSGRLDEALEAFDMAVGSPGRHPGMVAAALEERANLLRMSGEDLAAKADMERIATLAGDGPTEAIEPSRTISRAAPEVVDVELEIETTDADDPDAMIHARGRVRRRITGIGTPGSFGGRHHRTYQADVEAMLTAGQFEAAENLLLGLLDAVEDEAEESAIPIDPTFYLTLADLFSHRGQRAEARAVEERFERAGQRYGTLADTELADAMSAMEELDGRANSEGQPVG